MGESSFWNDPEKAKETIQELKALNGVLKPFEALCNQGDDIKSILEMAEEEDSNLFDDELRDRQTRRRRFRRL